MHLIGQAVAAGARQQRCCQVIGLSARTLQRWRAMQHEQGVCVDQRTEREQRPTNQLTQTERLTILETANSAQFAHLPPSQIVPRLADSGIYIGSESSIYRVLREHLQLQHRGRQKPAGSISKPRALQADQPGQLMSWDITYLPTIVRGLFFYLYLFIDLYSRKIVGWQVYENESADKAAQLLKDICIREGIEPEQATLHSDNGSPMKGATMLMMMQTLGVVPSFSRPAVSNDNPYSESLFKTLKYRPQYPKKPFEDLLQARVWVGQFVQWYNEQHRHSSIGFVTPNERHESRDIELLNKRHRLYQQARAQHPERWSGNTRNWAHQKTVYLNPERQLQKQEKQKNQKAA
jgi:putative transposase